MKGLSSKKTKKMNFFEGREGEIESRRRGHLPSLYTLSGLSDYRATTKRQTSHNVKQAAKQSEKMEKIKTIYASVFPRFQGRRVDIDGEKRKKPS